MSAKGREFIPATVLLQSGAERADWFLPGTSCLFATVAWWLVRPEIEDSKGRRHLPAVLTGLPDTFGFSLVSHDGGGLQGHAGVAGCRLLDHAVEEKFRGAEEVERCIWVLRLMDRWERQCDVEVGG